MANFHLNGPKVDPKSPQGDPKLTLKLYKVIKIEYKNGRIPSDRASQKLSIARFGSKLCRASFEGIGVRFYEILQ